MSPLSPLRRRAPWVAGVVLLALVGLPLLGAGLRFGLQYWPWLLGAGAFALLGACWLERWWQSRPVSPRKSRSSSRSRSRFKVVDGGRAQKGVPHELDADDDDSDEPRWLM
jgi:protein-S-isoprenylcysteine O-methyltransferase Ste14